MLRCCDIRVVASNHLNACRCAAKPTSVEAKATRRKGKRFNSEIISSMIESLIHGGSRRSIRLRRVSDGPHLQEEYS